MYCTQASKDIPELLLAGTGQAKKYKQQQSFKIHPFLMSGESLEFLFTQIENTGNVFLPNQIADPSRLECINRLGQTVYCSLGSLLLRYKELKGGPSSCRCSTTVPSLPPSIFMQTSGEGQTPTISLFSCTKSGISLKRSKHNFTLGWFTKDALATYGLLLASGD